MGAHMSMSSVNISITEKVYRRLQHLKAKDESFSQAIWRLSQERDIRRCYGLLKDEDSTVWASVLAEMARVRAHPLRGVRP